MKHRIPIAIAIVLLLAGGSAWYFWPQVASPPPVVTAPAADAPAAAPAPTAAAPAIAHPVPPADAGTKTLPPIEGADAPLMNSLLGLPGGSGLAALLVPQSLLRHFVATVDNLPRHHLAAEQRPLKPTPGAFLVAGDEESGTADPLNAERYAPALKVLQSIEPEALFKLYRQWYPLLQQAYQDLGYPDGYFNDRMVAALDDMLAAPQPTTPPKLVRPNVLWVYADDSLEQRSAGQRLMLRLPAVQAQALRARLQLLRGLVATPPPKVNAAR
jgi:hypothetical protein